MKELKELRETLAGAITARWSPENIESLTRAIYNLAQAEKALEDAQYMAALAEQTRKETSLWKEEAKVGQDSKETLET